MPNYENNFHFLLLLNVDLTLMQIVVLKVKGETYPQFWELKIVYLGIFYFQLMTKLLQLSCFRCVFLKHS